MKLQFLSLKQNVLARGPETEEAEVETEEEVTETLIAEQKEVKKKKSLIGSDELNAFYNEKFTLVIAVINKLLFSPSMF